MSLLSVQRIATAYDRIDVIHDLSLSVFGVCAVASRCLGGLRVGWLCGAAAAALLTGGVRCLP